MKASQIGNSEGKCPLFSYERECLKVNINP